MSPRWHGNPSDKNEFPPAIVELPDKLSAIVLDLRRLSYHEGPRIGRHAVLAINNCCDRLHDLMADVLKTVRHVDAEPALDGPLHAARASKDGAGKPGGIYRSVKSYPTVE